MRYSLLALAACAFFIILATVLSLAVAYFDLGLGLIFMPHFLAGMAYLETCHFIQTKKAEKMYFKKENGKQILDLAGDLIISHNKNLVISRVKSAAPASVRNPLYVMINELSFYRKVKATFLVVRYIWKKVKPIDEPKAE